MTLSDQIKSGFEELKGLFSKAPAAVAGLEELQANFDTQKAELAEAKTKLTQAEADLTAAKASILSLTAAKEKAETDLAAANAKIENPTGAIKTAASAQAAAIVAGIGVPPVAAAPPNPVPASKSLTGLERAIAAHKESQPSK